MERMTMRKALAAAFLSGVAGLSAGCGGSESGARSTGPSAPATQAETAPAAQTETSPEGTAEGTVTAPPTPDPTVDDGAIATRALLRLKDMPSGWVAADDEDEDGDDGDGDDEDTDTCPAIKTAKAATTARDSAPDLSYNNETVQVQDTVYLFATEQEAETHMAAITGVGNRRCMSKALAKLLKDVDDLELAGAVKSSELNVDDVGDETAAARLVIPLKSRGVALDATYDLVVSRVGRGFSATFFCAVMTSFDDDLRASLTRKGASRLKRALAV
jgi:hypothetical protein